MSWRKLDSNSIACLAAVLTINQLVQESGIRTEVFGFVQDQGALLGCDRWEESDRDAPLGMPQSKGWCPGTINQQL